MSLSQAETEPRIEVPHIVVSPARAAQMLDCGLSHIYELIKRGELKSSRVGHLRRIHVSSIYALLDRHEGEQGIDMSSATEASLIARGHR
jgi:excisionase family DNA binding protein